MTVVMKHKLSPMVPLVGVLSEYEVTFELVESISASNKQGAKSCVRLIALKHSWGWRPMVTLSILVVLACTCPQLLLLFNPLGCYLMFI